MVDLINGKTPDEIKRRLKGLAFDCTGITCDECEYTGVCKAVSDCKTPEYTLAYIERLEAERDAALAKVPRWIGVEERLPDTTNVYLIHMVHRYNKNDGYRCMDVRLFFNGEFEPWQGLPDIYEVTHWMPLPEPPKEGE